MEWKAIWMFIGGGWTSCRRERMEGVRAGVLWGLMVLDGVGSRLIGRGCSQVTPTWTTFHKIMLKCTLKKWIIIMITTGMNASIRIPWAQIGYWAREIKWGASMKAPLRSSLLILARNTSEFRVIISQKSSITRFMWIILIKMVPILPKAPLRSRIHHFKQEKSGMEQLILILWVQSMVWLTPQTAWN